MQDDVEEDHDHSHGHDKNDKDKPEYDEHIWTSPKNAKLIVQKISDTLCEIDSVNANLFKKNTKAYLAKLDELDSKFQDTVKNGVRNTIVFGDRFPFRYFADAYKLRYFAAFPGCSTETDVNPATVKFLIDKIRAEKIPVVFHVELSNQKMAATISEATGAKVRLLHAAHNITKADFKSGRGYLDIMTKNVSALKEALE
jgi:zinc transport system substrate-binding protein